MNGTDDERRNECPDANPTKGAYGPWAMITLAGRLVDPLSMGPEDVDILHIARALATVCHFKGTPLGFYSVAQHSVEVSYAVPAADALWGLCHDAAEAYLGDVPGPAKWGLPDYLQAEAQVMAAVKTAFGLGAEPKSVKRADANCTAAEGATFWPGSDHALWLQVAATCPSEWRMPRVLLDWRQAERVFLARFAELKQHPLDPVALAGWR